MAHHEHCGCGCEEDDDDDDCCACGCGCGHDHAHGDENVFGRKFFLRFGIGLAFFLAAVFLHGRNDLHDSLYLRISDFRV